MPFATTNLVRECLGSVNVLRGNWSANRSDAANGSVTGKGRGLSARFLTNNSTTPQNEVPVRVTQSSNDWTVTVPVTDTVADGTFEIWFK